MRRPNGEEISSQINFILVELSKLENIAAKPVNKLTPLEMWAVFFRYSPDVKHRDLVNNVIAERKEIAMADTDSNLNPICLSRLSAGKRLLRVSRSRSVR